MSIGSGIAYFACVLLTWTMIKNGHAVSAVMLHLGACLLIYICERLRQPAIEVPKVS